MVDKFVSRMHKHVRLITVFAVVAALFICAVFVCVKPTTARADGGISASDYFTTDATGIVDSDGGVQIYSDKSSAWQARFNGIFNGDFSMHFDFSALDAMLGLESENRYSPTGQLTVRVAAANDETNYFDVIYARMINDSGENNTDGGGYTDARVEYKGEVRTSNVNSAPMTRRIGWNTVLPALQQKAGEHMHPRSGELAFTWAGDILSVKVTNYKNNEVAGLKAIAVFDGTQDENFYIGDDDGSWSNAKWKLPKLDFSSGYTVTLISEKWDNSWSTQWANDLAYYPKNAPIEIQSVNGRDMGTNGTGPIPRFASAPTFGDIPTLHAKVGTALSVPDVAVTLLNSEQTAVTNGSQWKTTVQSAVSAAYAEETEIDGTFTPDACGDYTLTYYGSESLANAALNKKSATVTAYEKGVTDFVTATNNVTVAAGKTNSTVLPSLGDKGLGLTFDGNGTVKLNAVFTGDFDLAFQIDSFAHKGIRQFDTLTFRFTPIAGGKPIDAVVYTGAPIQSDDWVSYFYIGYGEQKYTTSREDENTIFDTAAIQNPDSDTMTGKAGMCDALLTWSTAWGGRPNAPDHLGVLKFDRENIAFKTKAPTDAHGYYEYTLAKFGEEKPVAGEDTRKFKWDNDTVSADFTNGYTVEIIGVTTQTDATVTLHALNGLTLASDGLPVALEAESKIIKGKSSVSIERKSAAYIDDGVYIVRQATGGGINLLSGETATGFTVKNGGADVADFTLANAAGTYTVDYGGGVTRSVVLTEDVTAPAVSWKDGTPDSFAVGGVTPRIDDVTAIDALDGTVTPTADNTKIYVKKGDGAETPYTSAYTFETGAHTVLYKVKDSHDNEGVYAWDVYIVNRTAAEFTIGDVPTAAIVGKEVALPTATGTVDGTPYAVTVSVVSPTGVSVVTNASAESVQRFTASEAGAYQLIYRMTVQSDDPIIREYTLTATVDETKPTITVSVKQTSVGTGKVVTVPTATATDPEDGAVLVSYVVKFGTTEIAVTDGKFTPENEGTYTIVYTATDASGNTETLSFTVTAVAGGADWTNQASTDGSDEPTTIEQPKSGCGCGSVTAGSALGIAVAAMLAAGLCVLLKRKSNTDQTNR